MIHLIKNEIYKIKISKIITSWIILLIILLLMIKFSKKSAFSLSFNLIPIIGILTILIFGGILNGEIESGAMRFYLTKPASRLKIYVSKQLAIMGYSYISVLLCTFFTSIFSSKIDLFYLSKYFSYAFPLFLLNSLILNFSCKIRSKSFTICFISLLFSFSLLLMQILLDIDLKFITYTFIPYLDFSIFDDIGNLNNLNVTYGININIRSGVLIDTIYTILFFVTGLLSFLKKDIKA